MENKEYEITTFAQLVDIITPENCDRLSADFTLWIKSIAEMSAFVKQNPESKDISLSELFVASFKWTDDGENEFKHFELHNETTGEITIFNIETENSNSK